MPTYEYECTDCGKKFERRQAITEAPLAECPACQGAVHRVISGGAGFVMKGGDHGRTARQRNGCSIETSGRTCCGRDERCGKPPCGGTG
jgi:putative FmdB family regulatory protein